MQVAICGAEEDIDRITLKSHGHQDDHSYLTPIDLRDSVDHFEIISECYVDGLINMSCLHVELYYNSGLFALDPNGPINR